jgi:hypothetical protein
MVVTGSSTQLEILGTQSVRFASPGITVTFIQSVRSALVLGNIPKRVFRGTGEKDTFYLTNR